MCHSKPRNEKKKKMLSTKLYICLKLFSIFEGKMYEILKKISSKIDAEPFDLDIKVKGD